MDAEICGLNKVHCVKGDTSYAGKKVQISNGLNTWEKNLDANSETVFLIPNIPAPAKNSYTLKVFDGTTVKYSKTFELGFGDSITIIMDNNYDYVTKKTAASTESILRGLITDAQKSAADAYSLASKVGRRSVMGRSSELYYVTNGTITAGNSALFDIPSVSPPNNSRIIDVTRIQPYNQNFDYDIGDVWVWYNYDDIRLSFRFKNRSSSTMTITAFKVDFIYQNINVN